MGAGRPPAQGQMLGAPRSWKRQGGPSPGDFLEGSQSWDPLNRPGTRGPQTCGLHMWIAAVQRGVLCDGRPPATEQESWFPSTQKPLSPTPREKVGSLVPSSPSGMMTVLLSPGRFQNA